MSFSLPKIQVERPRLLIEIGAALSIALFAGLFFRFLVFIPYSVTDRSMTPVLVPGDKVLTNRLIKRVTAGFWDPDPSGLLVFKHPAYPKYKAIKRLIAKSGDKIEVHNKQLIINGELNTDYKFHKDYGIRRDGLTDPRDSFAPLEIPEPGDTLVFSKLGIREFDFAVSLLKQEVPGSTYEIICTVMMNDEPVNTEQFQSEFHLDLDEKKKFNPAEMSWYNLISLSHQLRLRFSNKKVVFKKVLFKDGKECLYHIVENPCYFVMGDNWEESYDSRFWGYVSRKSIISKPLFIYWSQEPKTWIKINFSRLLKIVR
jgi:signal peptidase I